MKMDMRTKMKMHVGVGVGVKLKAGIAKDQELMGGVDATRE